MSIEELKKAEPDTDNNFPKPSITLTISLVSSIFSLFSLRPLGGSQHNAVNNNDLLLFKSSKKRFNKYDRIVPVRFWYF